MLLKISVNSPCVNLNVSWNKTGSKSCMRLIGPIAPVRSRGRCNNISRNPHALRVEMMPAPKPLRCNISNKCGRLPWRPDNMSVFMNLFEDVCNMKSRGTNIAVLLMRRFTMTFWHAYSAVRRFSLALGWSLCNGILQHSLCIAPCSCNCLVRIRNFARDREIAFS